MWRNCVAGCLDSWLSGSVGRQLRVDAPTLSDDDLTKNTQPQWGGTWSATCSEDVIDDAIRLYTDKLLWEHSQFQGLPIRKGGTCMLMHVSYILPLLGEVRESFLVLDPTIGYSA